MQILLLEDRLVYGTLSRRIGTARPPAQLLGEARPRPPGSMVVGRVASEHASPGHIFSLIRGEYSEFMN
jgi:hypothetical protein